MTAFLSRPAVSALGAMAAGALAVTILVLAPVTAPAAASTTVLSIDFEDEALGPLGPPWSVAPPSGPSAVSVVAAGAHGHAMALQGDVGEGAFVTASTALSTSSRRVTALVDIRPSAGSAFVWSLTGAGDSIGARRVRLQVAPGTGVLVAQTSPSGSTSCGPLPAGAWTRVTLVVDARHEPHTFDVRIGGMPTACTGVETGLGPPFDGVGVMDASNAGWGGDVLFDNFRVIAK